MKLTGIFRRFLTLLFLLSFILNPAWGVEAKPANQVAGESEPMGVKVLHAGSQGIHLELTVINPIIETQAVNGQTCHSISIPGLPQLELPGIPALPVQGAMLGIPQDAQPVVEVLATESAFQKLDTPLCIPLEPVLSRSPQAPYQLEGYRQGTAAPVQTISPPAELIATGKLRSQRYAEVRFNPVLYHPESGEIETFQRIQVMVHFNSTQGGGEDQRVSRKAGMIAEGPFEESLRNLLLNYEQARGWRSREIGPVESTGQLAQPASDAPQSSGAYKILVNQDGIYQVSYAELQTAGVPVDSLDPRTFQLFNLGGEVAIQVVGEADGIFHSTDTLLFFGQKTNTKFTDTNVYWLAWGGVNGVRMASLEGAPSGLGDVPSEYLTTERMEVDTEYYADEPSGSNKDHWYWGEVYAFSGPAQLEFTTELQHLGASSNTITVRGLLNGFAATPNHHTQIFLNDILIDDHSFPTGSEYSFSVNVPQSYLVEGTNTIKVLCPRDGAITYDQVLVNWFEIEYYATYFAEGDQLRFGEDSPGLWEFQIDGFSSASIEAYDLTNPQAPQIINGAVVQATANGQQVAFEANNSTGHAYLVQTTSQRLIPLDIKADNQTNWKTNTIGADYIIISHAVFLSEIQPLATFRAGQNLRVQVLDVQDIYDEFNYGVFSPEAIRSFVSFAYANWVAPAPSFVLLVGDGHFDYKNTYGWNEPTFIPPYLDEVDPEVGETATDNRYVSVSGSDILPDLYIGRFPVRTAEETQTMVEKTINYEQVAPVGGWNANQLFLADNADSGGNFAALSDDIITTYVPDDYTVDKIYYGINYTDVGAARSALQNAINQGRLIVHYSGHGNVQIWGGEGFLTDLDIPNLTNGSKLPFIIPMTCAEGYFIWPNPPGNDYSAIAEIFVRTNGRGAIASWSSTGYGLSAGHDLLDQNLFDNLFNNQQTQIGYLTTQAKYYLYANSASYRDLIETFTLFGDPALRLQTLEFPPFDPSNLTATPISSSQIDLSWQDNSDDESQFRIERSPDGLTGWTEIDSAAAGATSYSDTDLNCETGYHYRVRAYRSSDGEFSEYSNNASAATYPCRTISLVPGWNLITLPLNTLTSFSSETILQDIQAQGGSCVEIMEWLNGGWNSHEIGLPFGDFSILMGKGYFVRCNLGSNWLIEGSRLGIGPRIDLAPGWNLIGVPYPESGYQADAVLSEINAQGGACTEIMRWYNSGWEAYIPGIPVNDFDILPQQGYFVQCSAASSYISDGVSP